MIGVQFQKRKMPVEMMTMGESSTIRDMLKFPFFSVKFLLIGVQILFRFTINIFRDIIINIEPPNAGNAEFLRDSSSRALRECIGGRYTGIQKINSE